MIYKILSNKEWRAAQHAGEFAGSAVDRADGYIHFSTADQMRETAAKHFHGQHDLVLLAIDDNILGDALRWEISRGGALFPHLYAPLAASAVQQHWPLPWNGNAHVFPEGV